MIEGASFLDSFRRGLDCVAREALNPQYSGKEGQASDLLVQAKTEGLRRSALFIPTQGGLDEHPGFSVTAQEMVGHTRNPLAGCDRFLIPGDLGQFNQLRRMSERFDISATAEVKKPKAVVRLELRLQVRYPPRKIKSPSPCCARLFDRPLCPGQRGAEGCLEG